MVQAQVDQGQRPGPSSEDLAEIKRLRAENYDLKEANEILKSASICSVTTYLRRRALPAAKCRCLRTADLSALLAGPTQFDGGQGG